MCWGVGRATWRWAVEARGRWVRKPPGSWPWQEGVGPRVLIQVWWMAVGNIRWRRPGKGREFGVAIGSGGATRR